MTAPLVSREDTDGIALLVIASPPVNALGLALRRALDEMIRMVNQDPDIRAVVLTGAGRVFVGGADISEFDRPPEAPHLPDLIAAIEDSPKPWIAALNGAALGGGAELALGCHYRILSPTARIALPETRLGILPGAGGTQRLLRLIGVEAALEVITDGREISAEEARRIGLADRLAETDLIPGAQHFAREVAAAPLPQAASRRGVEDPGQAFWQATEARIAKSARGNPGPAAALAALREGVTAGITAGLALERQSFLSLRASDEAAALRYLFFAERAAPRPTALRDSPAKPVQHAGVVGGGTMGSGIAAALANAGFRVTLSETSEAALATGMARIAAIFAAQARRGLHEEAGATDRLARISGVVGLESLATCDLVIEAVFEDLAVKRAVFADLARLCGSDTILASNTSYLDPEAIVAGLPGAGRFIALHFFSPAQVMKLLEIIPLRATAPETLATGFALAARLGKIPVQAGNCPGFIGNRILKRYRLAAQDLLRDRLRPAAIDAAMRGFGFAMGPFEAQDMAGLDIAFRAREAERAAGGALPETLDDILVRAGRLGQKSGAGWYDYPAGGRIPQTSAAAQLLLDTHCAPTREMAPEAIAAHLTGIMAAEGQLILEEGIAQSPQDIDLVEVHGYGFPRHRGGPMFAHQRRGTPPG